jgi:hypothetical protein
VWPVYAEELQDFLPRGAELIGIAESEGNDPPFDKHIKGEIDLLVPLLRQVASDATILIEAYYPGKKGKIREQQVSRAFALAEQSQQYLRSKHDLSRDFFVAIWEKAESAGELPKIRITTYPRDFFEN